jgi:hypothetical protein
VTEDFRNGVLAAEAAGLRSAATTNVYTDNENLSDASIVVTSLGDQGGEERILRRSDKSFEFDGVLHVEQLMKYFSSE